MISEAALTVIIPLLFVILFQFVKFIRETPIHANIDEVENAPPGERPTVEYPTFQEENLVFVLTDFLPTLSRWSSGPTGIFGIFHYLLSYFIIISGGWLFYLANQGFVAAKIGMIGMGVIWVLLPFFEVKEYSDLVRRGIRPRSVEWQIVGTLVIIFSLGILSNVFFGLRELAVELGFGKYKNLLLIVFYPVWRFHDLYFQKAYIAMVHDEVKAAREKFSG